MHKRYLDTAILQDKIPICWMYMLQIRSGTSGRVGHSSHKLWPNSSANSLSLGIAKAAQHKPFKTAPCSLCPKGCKKEKEDT